MEKWKTENPLLVTETEGHKSQTRLIFRNTYGDAFNVVRTLTDGGLEESWVESSRERVIDYIFLMLRGDCGLKFYVNLTKSPLSFAQFFSSSFSKLLSIDVSISKSRQALPSRTKKTIQFWAPNLCVTNQSVSVSVITRFSQNHDMNQIIESFLYARKDQGKTESREKFDILNNCGNLALKDCRGFAIDGS